MVLKVHFEPDMVCLLNLENVTKIMHYYQNKQIT